MKRQKSASEIIKLYIEYATAEGVSKLEGDYKTGNTMVKKLNKLAEQFIDDPILANEVLSTILNTDAVRAKSLAEIGRASCRERLYI